MQKVMTRVKMFELSRHWPQNQCSSREFSVAGNLGRVREILIERESAFWLLDLTRYQLHAIYGTTQNRVCCDWCSRKLKFLRWIQLNFKKDELTINYFRTCNVNCTALVHLLIFLVFSSTSIIHNILFLIIWLVHYNS